MLSAVAVRSAAIVALLAAAALAGGVSGASAQITSAQSMSDQSMSDQSIGQQARTDDLAALRQIDVPAAWSQSKGSGVTVAVLDTGVRPGTPDLTGQVTVGPDYTVGANPPGYLPPHLHGTYIGSIIAGHGSGPGGSQGVIGVAPEAKILSVRVILDDQEPGFLVYNENAEYDDAIASGITYAVRHGAGIINMSLGSTVATRSVRQALAYAISHNVVVVAAAGNDGTGGHGFTPYSYPASFTGVISVAAVGVNGNRASFSDQNSSVVVSAPGVNVVGDGPGGSYLIGSGTSPASAFVAGVAALIRSQYPRLSVVQVMQSIVSSAQRRPPGGYSPATGFGEVDAAAALAAAGRLEGPARPAGLAAGAYFGGGPGGPIVVIHRDRGLIAELIVLAIAALCLFAVVLPMLIISVRRYRRRPFPPGSLPPDPPASAFPDPPVSPESAGP
jgi:type VII secretion-associated serine protease mycosin